MHTRDQEYSTKVYKKVLAAKQAFPKTYRKYGALSHKLPILIHTAGLAQALAYVESRGKSRKEDDVYRTFLADLSETVGMGTTLCEKAREVELPQYMHLTRQVLAALLWYKRFAQSLLKVEASESLEEEGV